MGNFRKQGYALHLRYSWINQNDGRAIDLEGCIKWIKNKLKTKRPSVFGRMHVGTRSMAAGNMAPTHAHIYVAQTLGEGHPKIDIKNMAYFDYFGCHPSIEVARGTPQENWDYINKAEEPTTQMKLENHRWVVKHWLNLYVKKKSIQKLL